MMTKSCARAACSTVVAVAPVSAAGAARDAGPRELAIDTWCPSRLRCLARVLPTLPEEERLFTDEVKGKKVWVMEDTQAITLLYPEEY